MAGNQPIPWGEIRSYYEDGHTMRQCQERYGFSNGAWQHAVQAGLVVPRARSSGIRASEKRALIGKLIAEGKSYGAIARELGLTKPTVAYHARRLGIPADDRYARRYDWPTIQAAYDGGLSLDECVERFGFSKSSWCQAVERGDIVPRPREMPLEELLVKGRRRGRENVKRRLIAAGLKEWRCELCTGTEWRDMPIPLQLHHANGDGADNRLRNLLLLCPNCHAQTETWGGRNKARRVIGQLLDEAA